MKSKQKAIYYSTWSESPFMDRLNDYEVLHCYDMFAENIFRTLKECQIDEHNNIVNIKIERIGCNNYIKSDINNKSINITI